MSIIGKSLLLGFALSPIAIASMATGAQANAQTEAEREFDIAAGPLDAALVAFASQSGVQLLYTADLVSGLTTVGVRGRLSPQAALQQLLAQTNITASSRRSGVVVLRRRQSADVTPLEATDVGEVRRSRF
ncbi:hypothetical protein LTR94_024266 [Friedmanniomyces endolithicus]|nr:hypothetical protein LTR94_024266 [Friedmanniomyces endolithicus]